ncbi:MAG: beta-ketoacyl-ACP synthase II [Candidatus Rokubacteria bacterium]|nr:beta-ketoacyl-ACP synthase II [Candidatus Rokubacteria bacterium]
MKRRVVITGMGAVSPLGPDLVSTWAAVRQGKSGVGPITLFDASTFPCRIAAEVRDSALDPLTGQERRLAKYLNRGARFGMAASRMAMADAGLGPGADAPTRLGVAVGSSGSRPDLKSLGFICRTLTEPGRGPAALDPVGFLSRASSTGASILAIVHNAQGPTLNVSTACAASAQAIAAAFRIIQRGDADLMISGGFDSMICELDVLGFSLVGALSTRNAEPQKASRPFDRDRDGFVLGEGAAVVILEERAHALARGAKIHAELAGYGTTMNAYRMTDSPPDGGGAVQAMEAALADAGVRPSDVSYINAHGTSTAGNDRSETAAIKRVFGDYAYQVPVSSTKSMTGHLIAAAGALELVFCVCSLRDQIVPPTINYENPDPRCDLDYVPLQARPVAVGVALSNSFAFGGNNASLVVRAHR